MTDEPTTETEPVIDTFQLEIGMPYTVPQPDCCPNYSVTITTDGYGKYFADYTHRKTCDIWRFVP